MFNFEPIPFGKEFVPSYRLRCISAVFLQGWLWHEITHEAWYARGVIVIVLGNGHGDTSSNPGQDWLYFTLYSYPWERYESNYSPSSYG